MLSILISIVGILATILIIIGIHEFGHFLAARCLGVKVLKFSIGFGKTLWRKFDKNGTEYVFAAIPLGGYVKMLDENEETVSEEERHLAFNQQPYYKKFIIVAAGPLSNLILAFGLYWLIFVMGFTSVVPVVGKVTPNSIAADAGLKPKQEIISIDNTVTHSWMNVIVRILAHTGDTDQMEIVTKPIDGQITKKYLLDLTHWHMDDLKPDPLSSLGFLPYEPEVPGIIGKILPDSPAANADLKVNDEIIALNGKPILDWIDLVTIIDQNPAQKLSLTIKRNGKTHIVDVNTSYQRDMLFKKHGFLGISPQFNGSQNNYLLRKIQYGPIDAITQAWRNTSDFTRLNFMITGKLLTGKVSLQSLGGPISIFQSAGSALNQGFIAFISFLAFLSISIGIINIFPIPGLDGGHLLLQTIEVIIRRPIPPHVLGFIYRIGVIFLFLLIFQAIINDILRLQ